MTIEREQERLKGKRPRTVERKEERRVEALRVKAKRSRAKIRIQDGSQRTYPAYKRRDATFNLNLAVHPLGLTPAGIAALIQRKIIARAEAEANRKPAIQHVRNGKPLTEQGAKLLGVPWPSIEEAA